MTILVHPLTAMKRKTREGLTREQVYAYLRQAPRKRVRFRDGKLYSYVLVEVSDAR